MSALNRNTNAPVAGRMPVRLGVLGVLVLCVLAWCSTALAAAPVAAWSVHDLALPSVFTAADDSQCTSHGYCDVYQVTVMDAGGAAMDGSLITIADTLPTGVSVQRVEFFWSGFPQAFGGAHFNLAEFGLCPVEGGSVRCLLPTEAFGLQPVAPDDRLEMKVYVTVEPGASGSLTNNVTVTGGGAQSVSDSVTSPVNGPAPAFGFNGFTNWFAGLDGLPDTRAAGRPYELGQWIDLSSVFRISGESKGRSRTPISVHDVKNIVVDLPLGFAGSALAAPRCPLIGLSSQQLCPAATQVGYIRTEPDGFAQVESGVYNMVPEPGVLTKLGFIDATKAAHFIDVSIVPTPRGYVLRATSPQIPQTDLNSILVQLYGNPAGRNRSGNVPSAFFTLPSSCTGEPLVTSIHMDSWQNPARFNQDGTPDFTDPTWSSTTSTSPPVTGCNQLRFEPSLDLRPETTSADAASGLGVELKVPQNEDPETLATPPLRNARVTLPAGLSVNPAAADGLQACSETQIGWLGGSLTNFTTDPPACPEASKIGTVEVQSPAIEGVLQGTVYLATQDENPFHTLLAGYVVIDDPATGVLLKIPGSLSPDPSTGQIAGVFDENPQFPFSSLRLHFYGGARGKLATPTACGTYATTSDLMPWSAPDSGPDATPFSTFGVETGCSRGFTPGFTAGTTSSHAGGYSPFVLSLTRNDGEQNLAGITVTLPPGLLGKIAGIPLCPDANANAGTCPEASQVGTDNAGAGAGPDPFFVPGKVYLTGPYKGGPYGLVVEDPAVAGPFNLGMVAVRQSLRIDPHTAQVTAVSDPFPTILRGIPLRVRRIDVTLDRPGFTFNPTSCEPMQIVGQVTSAEGASANVANRFQATGCQGLAFKPSFKVATKAKTSKQNGAALNVNVTSGAGQANIGKVAVTLPKQLPSRLTTIQQACPEATFNANPASCPAGSDIGTATAHTPVLSNPVVGPAYLVSHGGAAFPDLVIILQGEGVTLDLVGTIDIKHAVTSSAFNTVPDAPIDSFVLSLPQGPHSALAATLPAKARGSLCGTSLVMPTTITGQNGAQIKQNTKIAVTGCGKAKPKKKVKKHKAGKGGKKKG